MKTITKLPGPIYVIIYFMAITLSLTSNAQKFEADWESLKQYKCPEWFRDAKLGIFLHWGPSSVPATDDWYGRNMYRQGHPAYEYHVKTFGHPSTFGFKDIIPLWKAENFDADKIIKTFKQAGARYIVPVAVFHDNFDLWDSEYQSWNAVNMGPKRDIVGAWKKAAIDNGLRFGVSTHMDRVPSWFNTSKGSDTSGPLAGVPYDGKNLRDSTLYGPLNNEDMDWAYLPKNAPDSWKETWYRRTKDLIGKYHPDLLYFDGGIPYVEVGLKLVSEYYNDNQKWYNGQLNAVLNLKKTKVSGAYQEGMCVQDLERSKLSGIKPEPWQTDTSIGSWFYNSRIPYESPNTIIDMLIDIVSKNGNLLLNVPLKADGTLDAGAQNILDEMGKWMSVNGESIYGTRPWTVYGEGPTSVTEGYSEKVKEKFTSQDFRFTTKGKILYAICLDWPECGETVRIRSISAKDAQKAVSGITLLGCRDSLKWSRNDDGLEIVLPDKKPCDHAFVFKIDLDNK